LLEGLKRLEYRGYDSCGVAVWQDGLKRARSVGRVASLQTQVTATGLQAHTGIAHTRWATHGAPHTVNAHPHFSNDGNGEPFIALVHNGIIENHEEIRAELRQKGYDCQSQTDSEVIAHLVNAHYQGDLLRAVQQATKRLRGAYALAVICKAEPGRLVGARLGCPLTVGIGERENFLASDGLALASATDKIIYLEDGDVVDLHADSVQITNGSDTAVTRTVNSLDPYAGEIDLTPYRHYMQKEIFEQPRVIGYALQNVKEITPTLFGEKAARVFSQIDGIQILACGTSYYAGVAAKYWLEALARIPTNVEVASEYRYRMPAANPNALVVVISQSGETADTLAALKHAKEMGHHHTLAICNVPHSAIVRETELVYLTGAGAEIGVASTKAFTSQLIGLFLLTLTLAKLRFYITSHQEGRYLDEFHRLPDALHTVLALEPQIAAWAETLASKQSVLFLGRGIHYPISLEGALKLKEISYVHAEAYPAGELKHGPLALVTDDMPVVVVAPNDGIIEKLASNIEEVRSRGGQLFVFADADALITINDCIRVIRLPRYYGSLSPILHVVPLQLLAYHVALARGTDVDKPRNLAKAVTVE
jgi:glucosamine--fructose-6-phosphate aminotransferase (isomerizing)